MSFATIAASVVLAVGPAGPVVLVGGPTGAAPEASTGLAAAHSADYDTESGADSDDTDRRDHDYGKCLRKQHPPRWCHEGLYLPPALGADQPGRLTPYPGYVSSPPGEQVAPLGGGYVATPPGEVIPPVGGGYVSSPPGVALPPVG